MRKAIVCAVMLILSSQAWAGVTVAELREKNDSGDEDIIALYQFYVLGVRDGWYVSFQVDHQEDANVMSLARDCVESNHRSLYYKVIDMPEDMDRVSVSVAVFSLLSECFYTGASKQQDFPTE